MLIAVVLIAVLGVFAYTKGVGWLKDQLSDTAEDYDGDGKGSVVVEVQSGDTATDIGATLEKADVVASADAFIEAAKANPQSTSIQVGFYELHKQMSAESALDLLLNPKVSMVNNTFTVPEGKRAKEIVAIVADAGGWTVKQVQAAYDDTKALGLPKYAEGDPEGYLFPATYNIAPDATPADVLKEMVDEFKSRAQALKLDAGAEALDRTPGEIVIIASLIQAEASRAEDLPKVASVIYNRLAIDMPLQLDSTLHYAVDSRGVIGAGDLTDIDSDYNTYDLAGLTPTPIDSPGEDALNAALHPEQTDFYYFVTVNLETGETKFAKTLDEHNVNVQELRDYCETSDEC